VEAMTLADRIVVMNDGNIEQIGTPDDIYHDPASRFVASFIGSPPMNFIEAEVVGENELEFRDGTRLIVPEQALPSESSVVIGIRPEKIKLFTGEGKGRFRLDIELVEKLGAGELLYSRIGEEAVVVTLAENSVVEASTCWAELSPDSLYYFSKESDRRL
jgi:sn-glycerol 3-phosphate transport system ATP-binding protein